MGETDGALNSGSLWSSGGGIMSSRSPVVLITVSNLKTTDQYDSR